MELLSIFLVGEISSGKSSFLNALAGGVVSCASLQRETIHPEIYVFSPNVDYKHPFQYLATVLDDKHRQNKSVSSSLIGSNIEVDRISHLSYGNDRILQLRSFIGSQPYKIYDFPGLNDSTDSTDIFYDMIEKNIGSCDMLLYITKAENAFLSKSETILFKKINDLCARVRTERGQYIQVCIIVNKFDDLSDDDLLDIYDSIPLKIPDIDRFRVSSHGLMVSNIVNNKLDMYIPYFFNNEIKKIFKNANYPLRDENIKYINDNQRIEFDLFKKTKGRPMNEGDWDNIMELIEDNMSNISKYRNDEMNNWLELKLQNLKTIIYTPHQNIRSNMIDINNAVAVFYDKHKIIDALRIFTTYIISHITAGILANYIFVYIISSNMIPPDDKKFFCRQIIEKIKELDDSHITPHHINIIALSVCYGIFNQHTDVPISDESLLLRILKQKCTWEECLIPCYICSDTELSDRSEAMTELSNRSEAMTELSDRSEAMTELSDRSEAMTELIDTETHNNVIDIFLDKLPHNNRVRILLYLETKIHLLDLKVMHNYGKIPYDLIRDILGDSAVIRLSMYISGMTDMEHPLFCKGEVTDISCYDIHGANLMGYNVPHNGIPTDDNFEDVIELFMGYNSRSKNRLITDRTNIYKNDETLRKFIIDEANVIVSNKIADIYATVDDLSKKVAELSRGLNSYGLTHKDTSFVYDELKNLRSEIECIKKNNADNNKILDGYKTSQMAIPKSVLMKFTNTELKSICGNMPRYVQQSGNKEEICDRLIANNARYDDIPGNTARQIVTKKFAIASATLASVSRLQLINMISSLSN